MPAETWAKPRPQRLPVTLRVPPPPRPGSSPLPEAQHNLGRGLIERRAGRAAHKPGHVSCTNPPSQRTPCTQRGPPQRTGGGVRRRRLLVLALDEEDLAAEGAH